MNLLFYISGPLIILILFFVVKLVIKNRFHFKTKARRIVFTILASFIIYLVIVLSAIYIFFSFTPELDFNQDVWRKEPAKRHLMLEDLKGSKELISNTTMEVKAKLGEPSKEDNEILEYKILEAGKLDFYENSLIIYFENDVVYKVNLKKRKLH
jgi:hypothetical protein